jgi:hypothetical protein
MKKLIIISLLLFCAINIHAKEKELFRMKQLSLTQKLYNNDFKTTATFFKIYLNKDMGRAKSLYLYLTNRLNQVNQTHENIVNIFQAYEGKEIDSASLVFTEETNLYFNSKATYENIQHLLRERYVFIDQLKENAQFVDTTRSILEIIEGRLDSDHDGTPDNVELSGNESSPINGTEHPH